MEPRPSIPGRGSPASSYFALQGQRVPQRQVVHPQFCVSIGLLPFEGPPDACRQKGKRRTGKRITVATVAAQGPQPRPP